MNFVVKEGDIVTLEDDLNYVVKKCLEVDGEGYLVLKKINLTTDAILQIEEAKEIVVQEIIDEDDNYFLRIVTDEKVLQNIEEITDYKK